MMIRKPQHILSQHTLSLVLAISTVACADSQSTSEQSPAEQIIVANKAQPEAAPTALAQVAAPALAADELTKLVSTIAPQEARNGSLRFSDARLDTPAAATLLMARLERGQDSDEVRTALALALPRTQGDFAPRAVEVLKTEKSEQTRAALVDAMRLANDDAAALEGLRIGMTDRAAAVRARAAFNIGRRADGLVLLDSLVIGLNDSEATVQASSARALGQLGAAEAFDKVLPGLGNRGADVRLESLRALGRMDAKRASTLPELAQLASDKDERIQTALAKVKQEAY